VFRQSSRVIEIDPVGREIVWSYPKRDAPGFYSSWGGTVQRLRNGSTAVADTESGRLLKVDAGGEIVREYWEKSHDGLRHTIKRSHRVTGEWGVERTEYCARRSIPHSGPAGSCSEK
jgi:hypothetical protein